MTLAVEPMDVFADRFLHAVERKGNPICVGLDPRFDSLPSHIRRLALRTHGTSARAVASAFLEFNRAILDAVADLVPVCKPQIAFYEEYGAEGIRAFEETVRYARAKGLVVISDAKRGDIGSTAEAYAAAQLGDGNTEIIGRGFDADAVTVNPYLGRDSLEPFLRYCGDRGKGVFVLVRTSNPGARDLQDLRADGRPVYEHVAEMVHELGGGRRGRLSDVGAVVGATYPEEARRLREIMPEAPFLVPGYGAQGAAAKDAVAGFRRDGTGAVVSSSRGIIFAFREKQYAELGDAKFADAAREAVLAMAAELKAAM